MNKLIKTDLYRFILIILIALMSASLVEAKSSLDLGLAGVGARPLSMGKAFVSVADDANAMILNPAGTGAFKSIGLTSMSTKLMGRVDYKMLGGLYPTPLGTLGISYIGINTPAGYYTTDQASLGSASTINYGSNMLVVSYGKDLSKNVRASKGTGSVLVGGNIKVINSQFEGTDITGASGSGYACDLALLLKRSNMSVGINLQNAISSMDWKSGTKEDYPMLIKVGASGNLLSNKLTLAIDADLAKNGSLAAHLGAEWRPMEILSLRAGLDEGNLTCGVGVNIKGLRFDYAYRQDSNLSDNSAHYLSISLAPMIGDENRVTSNENKTANTNIDRDILKYYQR